MGNSSCPEPIIIRSAFCVILSNHAVSQGMNERIRGLCHRHGPLSFASNTIYTFEKRLLGYYTYISVRFYAKKLKMIIYLYLNKGSQAKLSKEFFRYLLWDDCIVVH